MLTFVFRIMVTSWSILAPEVSSSSLFRFMEGSPVSCHEEGQRISTNVSGSRCFECICENGTPVCRKEICSDLSLCPVRLPQNNEDCCEKCKSCNYLGQIYQDNQEWFSDQDPCRRFICKAGVITEGTVACIAMCKNQIKRPGFCCPICEETSESLALVRLDPCVKCHCDHFFTPNLWSTNPLNFYSKQDYLIHKVEAKFCNCYRPACPVLDCSPDQRFTPPNSCCQECRVTVPKTAVVSNDGCYFRGEKIPNMKYFRPELCVFCACQEGSVLCQKFTCKLPNCSPNRLYYRDDLCCPLCLDKDPLPCIHRGKEYKHGQVWKANPCTTCRCSNSQINCTTLQCSFAQGCPKGYRLRPAPRGQCCHICQEHEATCTVYGDPHYKTFDGREYNFQGSCKYILTKSCRKSSAEFSVIVKNEPRGSPLVTWTRQVAIRIRGYRIVLLQNKRIKINKQPVIRPLPYVELGNFSLTYDKQRNVLFNYVQGLKVIWDGRSYLEVTVSSAHRSNLCGLCGDYDGQSTNDFQIRQSANDRQIVNRPQITKNAHTFASSWRTGSWQKCQNGLDRIRHRKEDRRRRKLFRLAARGRTFEFFDDNDFENEHNGVSHFNNNNNNNNNHYNNNINKNKTMPLLPSRIEPYVEESTSPSSLSSSSQRTTVAVIKTNDVIRSNSILFLDRYFQQRNAAKSTASQTGYDFYDVLNQRKRRFESRPNLLMQDSSAFSNLSPSNRDILVEKQSGNFQASSTAVDQRSTFLSNFSSKHNIDSSLTNSVGRLTEKSQRLKKRRRKRKHFDALCFQNQSPKRWNWAKRRCKLLKSPMFKPCHEAVSYRTFYKSCLMDVCTCPPNATCFCAVLQAYSFECQNYNISLPNWREKALCFEDYDCPLEGAVFQPCPPPSSSHCPPLSCNNYLNATVLNCYKTYSTSHSNYSNKVIDEHQSYSNPLRQQRRCSVRAGCSCPKMTVISHDNRRCVKTNEC